MNYNPGRPRFILREEIPDLQLHWTPIGEVNWHTEIITEEKSVKVPVRREELVVERKYLDRDQAGTEPRVETTRYVLREERLDYQMNPFDIQAVRIDKQPLQELQPVEVTLKKEILAIKKYEGIIAEIIDG